MITNKWVLGKSDFDEIYEIRKRVFVMEQHCEEKDEFDETDHYALHLVLYYQNQPAGTGRIYHDGHTLRIGRIAILPEFRGKKLGDLLIRLLLYRAFQSEADELVIHAQAYISHIYLKFGFQPFGEEFLEADIPHIAMRLKREDLVFPSQCGCH
jgi:predicted GNAT family N-acyltransferase